MCETVLVLGMCVLGLCLFRECMYVGRDCSMHVGTILVR